MKLLSFSPVHKLYIITGIFLLLQVLQSPSKGVNYQYEIMIFIFASSNKLHRSGFQNE